MRIAHIFNELKYSGAEIMYVDAATYFQKKGCQLFAVNSTTRLGEYSNAFKNAGYTVFHIPFRGASLFPIIRYCIQMISFFKKNQIEIVHIHAHRLLFIISFCAWISRKKTVYTYHNVFRSTQKCYIFHYMKRKVAKYVFKCTFQTISDSVYQNELKFYFNKTNLIYNWYNEERFFPEKNNEKINLRKELGIPLESLILISIGGCSHVKQHSEIIKALPSIKKRYPEIKYLHLGNGSDTPKELELVKRLGLESIVIFCDNQNNVRKYLIASDIYIMPSKFEGISLTTIEAMACQIPAILYNVPGLCDFNKNGENSILIEPDHALILDKINWIKNNPKKVKLMVENARKFVYNKFSLTKRVAEILKLYETIIQ